MQKILLLGSAPYIKDWFAENGEKYRAAGFKICPINNAWAACDGAFFWFRSEDFFFIPNTLKPDEAQRDQWFEVVRTLDYPFFYDKGRQGGTMILNILCHLMNHSFFSKTPYFIAIAGSDLIYKENGADHFYGKGTPDPMNIGIANLREHLRVIKMQAEQMSTSIVNVGGQEETLLPFARYQLDPNEVKNVERPLEQNDSPGES